MPACDAFDAHLRAVHAACLSHLGAFSPDGCSGTLRTTSWLHGRRRRQPGRCLLFTILSCSPFRSQLPIHLSARLSLPLPAELEDVHWRGRRRLHRWLCLPPHDPLGSAGGARTSAQGARQPGPSPQPPPASRCMRCHSLAPATCPAALGGAQAVPAHQLAALRHLVSATAGLRAGGVSLPGTACLFPPNLLLSCSRSLASVGSRAPAAAVLCGVLLSLSHLAARCRRMLVIPYRGATWVPPAALYYVATALAGFVGGQGPPMGAGRAGVWGATCAVVEGQSMSCPL